jgi:hypothetical protein
MSRQWHLPLLSFHVWPVAPSFHARRAPVRERTRSVSIDQCMRGHRAEQAWLSFSPWVRKKSDEAVHGKGPSLKEEPRNGAYEVAAQDREPVEVEDGDGVRCAVCGSTDGDPSSPIVSCDGCDLMVHASCYGNPLAHAIPDGDWFCSLCVAKKSKPHPRPPTGQGLLQRVRARVLPAQVCPRHPCLLRPRCRPLHWVPGGEGRRHRRRLLQRAHRAMGEGKIITTFFTD